MKKFFIVLLLVSIAFPLVFAGGDKDEPQGMGDPAEMVDPPAEEKAVKLVIGTGGTSGTYYPVGAILKTIFEKDETVDKITVESTGASVANLKNIDTGVNHLAIVMSDVAYDAAQGKGKFTAPIDFRALAGLYPNVVQIIALENSGIASVQDMKGKRVGVGKVGSGVEQSAFKVLESAGMTYDDLGQVSHTGYADSVQNMKNGNLDAAFFTSGIPNSSIVDAKQGLDIVFIPVDGAVADKLVQAYPYYAPYTIPAGDSKKYDLEQNVQTVSIRNLLVVHSSVSEKVTYAMAQRFYDYLGSEAVSISALKQFDRDSMGQGLVIEVAKGAQKFYDQVQ